MIKSLSLSHTYLNRRTRRGISGREGGTFLVADAGTAVVVSADGGHGRAVDHADDGDRQVNAKGVDEDEAEKADDSQTQTGRCPEWN